MQARTIKFTIEKGSHVSKEINKQNTIFAIFAPERVTIYPGQTIFIYTKFATFLIMPNLKTEGLKLIGQNHESKILIQRLRLSQ